MGVRCLTQEYNMMMLASNQTQWCGASSLSGLKYRLNLTSTPIVTVWQTAINNDRLIILWVYVESDHESEEEAADEEEDEPPAKRTRRGSRSASIPSPSKKGKRGQRKSVTTSPKSPGRKRKPAEPKTKKERKKKAVADKEKPRRAGMLIPNENIELLESDPTFETRFVEIKKSS